MQTFNMGRVPPVTFGAGRIAKVPDIVSELGGGPVLVIADAFLAQIGVTERLTDDLTERGLGYELAACIEGEPKDTLIDDLCARARSVGANTVIGIGGGAAMDAAKLVAAIARANEPCREFALAVRPLPSNGIPAIAIPTTAGTGSEVTRTSVVSTPEGSKNWYWGENLMFSQAILDPELTVSLPPHLTAWTGIDAVAHALEGSTARTTSPAGRLYGLEALRILSDALPKAVANGSDVELRGRVLWGSMIAGLALHNCNTHMGHNISHALGSLSRIHHGLATGLALEVTLPWLVARDDGAALYASASEAIGGNRTAGDLPKAFESLIRSCEIARALPQVCAGVSADALALAMKNPANRPMSQNSACVVEDSDLDEMASMMLALPLEQAA
ncbi:MAG: iron-containing alcohol dehydrogenase [Ruegeria sp.]